MAVENEDVLQAVTNLTDKVEKYHGDFREFRGEQSIKVKALEKEASDNRFWTKVQVVCVIPVVGGLHQIAQHLGWIK